MSTHLVLKLSRIQEHLNAEELNEFVELLEVIYNRTVEAGEKDHEYIVVNMDEPYAEEVVEVLKRNGHWDEPKSKEDTNNGK